FWRKALVEGNSNFGHYIGNDEGLAREARPSHGCEERIPRGAGAPAPHAGAGEAARRVHHPYAERRVEEYGESDPEADQLSQAYACPSCPEAPWRLGPFGRAMPVQPFSQVRKLLIVSSADTPARTSFVITSA